LSAPIPQHSNRDHQSVLSMKITRLRARNLRRGTVASVYLAVVIMAAVIVAAPAKAAALNISNDCGIFGPNVSGACSLIQIRADGGNPNLNWLQLSGSGSGNNFVDLSGDGTLSGALPAGLIPISWDFSITSNGAAVPFAWEVSFGLPANGQSIGFHADGTATTDTMVAGADSIQIPSDLDSGIWSIDLFIQLLDPPGQTVIAVNDFGGRTLDINPAIDAAPEPGSLFLVLVGTILLLLRKLIPRSAK
jgi:hypothetical protein